MHPLRAAEGRTQVVFGTGDPHADVVFVGEAPGAEEDQQGLPFVGRSGQLLDRLMEEEMGMRRGEGVYIPNTPAAGRPATATCSPRRSTPAGPGSRRSSS